MFYSVIIPVYNTQAYLEQCIESVLQQTFPDFELILVDDGSTDSSAQICGKYQQTDSRVHLFQKQNGGVSSARNLGMEKAEGEYIVFLDSDDYLDTDFLSILFTHLADRPDVLKTGFKLVNGQGDHLGMLPGPVFDSYFQTSESTLKAFGNQIVHKFGGWEVWGCAIRREPMVQNQIHFLEGYNYAEDLMVNLKLICCARHIISLDYAGYNYVQHTSSMMHTFQMEKKYDEINELFLNLYEFVGNSGHQDILPFFPIFYLMFFINQHINHSGKNEPVNRDTVFCFCKNTDFVNRMLNSGAITLTNCVKVYGLSHGIRNYMKIRGYTTEKTFCACLCRWYAKWKRS